ncbi:MAG: 30S ribosomal protein S3 [Candidatus Andersenbacteria bacterium]|nr:30S ribosomal protein S3 [Candidatus Andersenbacteria bacterium]MBI3251047.1 30S ribosomal protein S3 [Candidatus Andersenbacteria bacterium]
MGRKTNPNILRVGNITHNWEGRWFADKKEEFRTKLQEDLRIRVYFEKNLRHASISRLEISRQPRETVLTIHTSRPAVVIGRGGSGIEKIQKDLAKKVKVIGRVRIDVQEVRNPDTDATAVATQVVDQIERRMPFRRILKGSLQRILQAGARGAKISLSGRLNGSEIARTEWLAEGNVPLHTFRADVSYAYRVAFTTYGTIGIKVWINRGDLTEEKPEEAGKPIGEQKPVAKKRKRRSSLAEKAKTTKKIPAKK